MCGVPAAAQLCPLPGQKPHTQRLCPPQVPADVHNGAVQPLQLSADPGVGGAVKVSGGALLAAALGSWMQWTWGVPSPCTAQAEGLLCLPLTANAGAKGSWPADHASALPPSVLSEGEE